MSSKITMWFIYLIVSVEIILSSIDKLIRCDFAILQRIIYILFIVVVEISALIIVFILKEAFVTLHNINKELDEK